MNVVIVSGDFVRTGGMDRANLALAIYLAQKNPRDQIHIVAHRIAADLRSLPNVYFHRAAKPLDSYRLGAASLDRIGQRIARKLKDARVIVNGGNCNWGDVNWVHYLHAAWNPGNFDALPIVRRVKSRWGRNRSLADERAIVSRAKIVIANSQRTKRDLIERIGVAEERVRVVYYGTDPELFFPASDDQKRAARAELDLPLDRPILAFIGAVDDRRKGFDVLREAWNRANLDASLIVIGAGKAHREGTIHYLGFRQDVPRILRSCDAIVAPSRYEAYGLAIHEAICCGLAPIVSANAGIVERFPESLSSILLRDITSDELAFRLKMWQDYATHWRDIMRAISSDWRMRTWDEMAGEIADLVASC